MVRHVNPDKSLSITEAEYIAGSEGANDASWIRQLMKSGFRYAATEPVYGQQSGPETHQEQLLLPARMPYRPQIPLPPIGSHQREPINHRNKWESGSSRSVDETHPHDYNHSMEIGNWDIEPWIEELGDMLWLEELITRRVHGFNPEGFTPRERVSRSEVDSAGSNACPIEWGKLSRFS